MIDIVERLRGFAENCLKLEAAGGNEGAWLQIASTQRAAAAEIERLRAYIAEPVLKTEWEQQQAEIERLRGLLRDGVEIATTDSPYVTGTKARMRKWVEQVREAGGESDLPRVELRVEGMRRVREALGD